MSTTNTNLTGVAGLLASNIALTGPGGIASTLSQLNKGSANWLMPDSSFVFGNGATLLNGALQVNEMYQAQLTIAGAANVQLDLTTILDPFNTACAFTAIKLLMVAVQKSDGTVPDYNTLSLRVGPQGAVNAFQGPWGGTAAAQYETIYDQQRWVGPIAGWTVDGTHKILQITNPGGVSEYAQVLILGVQ